MAQQRPLRNPPPAGRARTAPRWWRSPRLALLVLAALPLAAACGGAASGSSGVASVGSTSTTAHTTSAGSGGGGNNNKADDALKFSQCMRSHGVTNFPDPQITGNRATIQISGRAGANGAGGLDPQSPQFQAAQSACQSLLPKGNPESPQQQAKDRDALVRFAQCMRSHGVDVPDPQSAGGGNAGITLRPGSGTGPGQDINSPQFQAAQSACQHFLPHNGAVTAQSPDSAAGGGK